MDTVHVTRRGSTTFGESRSLDRGQYLKLIQSEVRETLLRYLWCSLNMPIIQPDFQGSPTRCPLPGYIADLGGYGPKGRLAKYHDLDWSLMLLGIFDEGQNGRICPIWAFFDNLTPKKCQKMNLV